jgi:hypothetical protein
MVWINKERLKKGEPVGELREAGHHLFCGCKDLVVVETKTNLFESMAKRANICKQSQSDYNYKWNKKEGYHQVNFRDLFFSAGHGTWVEPKTTNRPGIGVEIKSRSGYIDENKHMSARVEIKKKSVTK